MRNLMRRVRQWWFVGAWVVIIGVAVIKTGGWTPHFRERSYDVGAKAPSILGVDFAQSARTVLVYVRSNCPHCTESMPFYRTLAQSEAVSSDRVQLVMTSAEPEPGLADYLRRHRLVSVRTVAGMHANVSGIRGTPTLIVVNSAGLIERVAVGRQSPSGERYLAGKRTLAASLDREIGCQRRRLRRPSRASLQGHISLYRPRDYLRHRRTAHGNRHHDPWHGLILCEVRCDGRKFGRRSESDSLFGQLERERFERL